MSSMDLVRDDLEEHLIDANERMGEALVKIGMALGLPRQTAQCRWGEAEILDRIVKLWAQVPMVPDAGQARGDDLCACHVGSPAWITREAEISERVNRYADAFAQENRRLLAIVHSLRARLGGTA